MFVVVERYLQLSRPGTATIFLTCYNHVSACRRGCDCLSVFCLLHLSVYSLLHNLYYCHI